MANASKRVNDALEAYLRAHKNLIELRGCQGDLQRDEQLWRSALELARELCDQARDAFAAELWALGFPTEELDAERFGALSLEEARARLQEAADRTGRRQRARRPDGSTALAVPRPSKRRRAR